MCSKGSLSQNLRLVPFVITFSPLLDVGAVFLRETLVVHLLETWKTKNVCLLRYPLLTNLQFC